MSPSLKRAAAAAVIIMICLTLVGWRILSGRTFYADYVVEQVSAAIGKMGGFELVTGLLSGNPVTGVICDAAMVRVDGDTILYADSISLRVDMPSVMSTPKLSVMEIKGASADVAAVISHLPEASSSGEPALDRLIVKDSEVMTQAGLVSIREAVVDISAGRYEMELSGEFMSDDLTIEADIASLSDGRMQVRSAMLEWGRLTMSAQGDIAPFDLLDARVEVSGMTADKIRVATNLDIFREIVGEASLSLHAYNDGGLRMDETICSKEGSIFGAAYKDLSADMSIVGSVVQVRSLEIEALGGSISANASIDIDPQYSPEIFINDMHVSLVGVDMSEIKHLFPQIEDIRSKFDLDCTVSGDSSTLSGYGTLRTEEVEYDGYRLSGLNADISLRDAGRLHADVSASAFGAKVHARADVSFAKDLAITSNIEISDLELSRLSEKIPKIGESGVKGRTSVLASVKGTASHPILRARISSPLIETSEGLKVQNVASVVQLKDGVVNIESASASIFGHEVTASASARLDDGASLSDIDARAGVRGVSLSSLTQIFPQADGYRLEGDLDIDVVISGDISSSNAAVYITSPRIDTIHNISLRNNNVKLSYSDGIIAVHDLTTEVFKTPISAHGIISLPSGKEPISYDVRGVFEKLDIAEAVRAISDDVDISGAMSGEFAVESRDGPPNVLLRISDSNVKLGELIHLEHLAGGVAIEDGSLRFDDLGSDLRSGKIAIKGIVDGIFSQDPMEQARLSLTVDAVSSDVGRISRMFMPQTKGYEGFLSGRAEIGGTASSPVVSADLSLNGLAAFGLFFPNVHVSRMRADASRVSMPDITARVGRGSIKAAASIDLVPDKRAEIVAEGRSVDIRALTHGLARDVRRSLSGALDFTFSGAGWLDSFEGRGDVSVPSFEGMGLKMTNFRAPVIVTDGYVMVEDSTAEAYGGRIEAQFARDLALSNWGGRFEIHGADFAAAYRDLAPDAEGVVTGSADVSLRIDGDSARTSMLDGDGSFDISNGEISGFAASDTISRLTGGSPIKFSSIHVPFHLDGRFLHLLPGTRISAPAADPLYRYATVDGSIALDTMEASVSCLGSISIRAINLFIGGFEGLISVAMDAGATTEDILSNFLGGAITGFSKNSYRDVSFILRATSDDVRVDKLAISQPEAIDTMPKALSNSDLDKDNKEHRFGLTVEIPVGPGGEKKNDIAGQLSGQVVEQLVKSIFRINKNN